MAIKASGLESLIGCDDRDAVLPRSGLVHIAGRPIRLLVMAFEFGRIRPEHTQDAYFVGERWAWVVGNERRRLGNQGPILAGDAVCDYLHVPAHATHDRRQR